MILDTGDAHRKAEPVIDWFRFGQTVRCNSEVKRQQKRNQSLTGLTLFEGTATPLRYPGLDQCTGSWNNIDTFEGTATEQTLRLRQIATIYWNNIDPFEGTATSATGLP